MSVRRIASFICCCLMSVAIIACGDAEAKSEGESLGNAIQFEEVQIEEIGNGEGLTYESSGENLNAAGSQPEGGQEEKNPEEKSKVELDGENLKQESSEDVVTAAEGQEKATQEEKNPTDEKKADGYGRMLFIGDSRTVDIFTEEKDKLLGETHDGICVYCMDGAQFKFMTDSIDGYGIDNFDTLVSWMGCNEFGDFSQYGPYYDGLLEKGKQLVVCTVGPTKDECLLDDLDYLYYPNANQIAYNNSLKAWAEGAGVRVIDLYTFIDSTDTIYQDPQDGIHYFPKPNPELWNKILSELGKK